MAALPKTLSFVSYAVNGHGLGHLMRMIAVNRWMRRYAAYAGIKTQHWFLTTSEADTLLHHEGFAGFKLPSKSVVGEAGIDKLDYIALAKQWVWHSIALLRPDVLVVDTFPNGSFHELMPVLDLCRHKALVLRPVRADFSGPAFRAVANLYDRVVVPTHANQNENVDALALDAHRLRYVGPVMRGESFERYDRPEARARLGVPLEVRCLLVSGGGGGDQAVEHLYAQLDTILRDEPDTHVVFAAGPLYRGRPRAGANRRWWTTPDLYEHLAAFDGAVTAGGFNGVHELLFAGVPTVFVPQEKIADDQKARVQMFVDQGAALVASLDDASLREALAKLRDPEQANKLSAAATAAVPRNHARDAAFEILQLVLPSGLLDNARDDLNDDLLSEARQLEIGVAELCELARALQPGVTVAENDLPLESALDLWRTARAAGASLSTTQPLVRLLAGKGRKGPEIDAATTAAAFAALITDVDVQHQWSALSMLARIWPTERGCDSATLAHTMQKLIHRAATQGLDVFTLARRVQEALDGGLIEDSRSLLAHLEASFASSSRVQL